MSSPTPAPAPVPVPATHPTGPPRQMSQVARIVQDMNNHFTEWLEFYNCEVQGAVLIRSVAIGHLTIDELNRLQDLLQCHGWRTSMRVSGEELELSLERAAAPISDGTAEFEAAVMAMTETGEAPKEKEEAMTTTTTECGICKAAEAVNPHCIDTCGHIFCFACIMSDPTMACPTCSAPYHLRNIAAAPISDGMAMQEAEEPAATNVCGVCNVADAVRPRYLDTCGHVFCADCITADCTSDEKGGASTCPTCTKPYRFRDVLRL